MSFTSAWVNSYKSVMQVSQDLTTGYLAGTYVSSTDGTGRYDVVGWASLKEATSEAGRTMAISILWRSNDGGHSDPSHEVSGMAGQVVVDNSVENLVLIHLFVETELKDVVEPGLTLKMGMYPDKLTFKPTSTILPVTDITTPSDNRFPLRKDQLSGKWAGKINEEKVEVTIKIPNLTETRIEGSISYSDHKTYPIVGFTDIYADPSTLNLQGVSYSTYIDEPDGRKCIAMAGYLNLTTGVITLTQLVSQSTSFDSIWCQVAQEQLSLNRASS